MDLVGSVKFIATGMALLGISLVFARFIYAQLCTTLTIPFKSMNDLAIYDNSVGKLLSPSLVFSSIPLAVSGSVALISKNDPEYVKLIIFVVCIAFFVFMAWVLSYRLFKKTVIKMGLKWPPQKELR